MTVRRARIEAHTGFHFGPGLTPLLRPFKSFAQLAANHLFLWPRERGVLQTANNFVAAGLIPGVPREPQQYSAAKSVRSFVLRVFVGEFA